MSQFQCTFSKSTTDCQILTVTDTSNYGYSNNDEHYLISTFPSRFFTIKDIFGNTLDVKTMTPSQTSVDFDISNLLSLSQLYLTVQLNLAMTGGGGYQTQVSGLLPCII